MPWCPECTRVFLEGKTECPSCHVPLKPGKPPILEDQPDPALGAPDPDMELVTIHTFSGPTAPIEADMAKQVLAAEGIKCAIAGEGSAEILPGVDTVQLMVREEEAEAAKEILESFFDNPPEFPEDFEEQE